MGIKFRVWGDYALFTRPEFGTERHSYDVITPSAARGLLESIYWHPGMRWIIDKIHVINQIQFTNMKTNEIKVKGSSDKAWSVMQGNTNEKLYINALEHRIQRNNIILKDVEYVIEAHFDMTENANPSDSPEKFTAITTERLKKGRCYHPPYFGCKQYPANFELYDESKQKESYYKDVEKEELGWMLYDLDYSDEEHITPMFFPAVMENGVINVDQSEVKR